MTIRPSASIMPALRHRNYRLFFVGQGLSLIGTWMTAVAQSWLVLQLTGNPFDLGLLAVAQFTPVLILGLFGGLIADSLPKRPTLYATNIVAMIVSAILFGLAVTHTVQLWHVFVLAIVMGVRNSIEMPTRQAFAVDMVGRGDIGNAVALNSALFNGARVIGPAIAGIAIGAFGVASAFLIDAISFLAVLVALFAMREDSLRQAPRLAQMQSVRAVFGNLAEGLSYVRNTGVALLAITIIGVVATFGINFSVVIPPLASLTLQVGAAGFGFLMAASGLGSLAAALLIAFRGTRPSRMLLGALVLGVAEMVMGGSNSYALDLLLMFTAGAGSISMMATANTTLQLAVPDALRGRVMSVYTTVFAGASPIGGVVIGAIAANAGAQAALFVGGLISVLAGIGGIVWYRSLRSSGQIPARIASTRSVAVPSGSLGPPGPTGAAPVSPVRSIR
ncbi:MAG TPA: MFS transporter [Candidatus Limnocylindrales bacterium]|nr:MFS transporter [Candidatus Limnocylindrales bacterium]